MKIKCIAGKTYSSSIYVQENRLHIFWCKGGVAYFYSTAYKSLNGVLVYIAQHEISSIFSPVFSTYSTIGPFQSYCSQHSIRNYKYSLPYLKFIYEFWPVAILLKNLTFKACNTSLVCISGRKYYKRKKKQTEKLVKPDTFRG